jgi:hypothetical protein
MRRCKKHWTSITSRVRQFHSRSDFHCRGDAEAGAATNKEQNEWAKLTLRALADHALRHEQDSNAALAELIAKHATDAPFQIAEVYGFRGESGEASTRSELK